MIINSLTLINQIISKMENRGGARKGAGRKPKADELELIEKLSPYDETALKQLIKGVEDGQFNFIKLFLEYRYGKVKEQIKIEHEPPPITRIERHIVYPPNDPQYEKETQ
jgi:hypothetical protein